MKYSTAALSNKPLLPLNKRYYLEEVPDDNVHHIQNRSYFPISAGLMLRDYL